MLRGRVRLLFLKTANRPSKPQSILGFARRTAQGQADRVVSCRLSGVRCQVSVVRCPLPVNAVREISRIHAPPLSNCPFFLSSALRPRFRPGLRTLASQSVAFSPDGRTIAAGYIADLRDGGRVVLWDFATRSRVVNEPFSVKEGDVSKVVYSPDAKTIAAGYRRGDVVVVALCDVNLESWQRRPPDRQSQFHPQGVA